MASRGYKSMFYVPLMAPRAVSWYAYACTTRDERTGEQIHLLDAFAHEAAIALEIPRLYETAGCVVTKSVNQCSRR